MTAPRPVLFALFVLTAALVGCGQPPTGTAAPGGAAAPTGTAASSAGTEVVDAETVQVSDQAGVTVKVAWAGTSAGAEFEVTLDTHSVDLDSLDLADATARNDRGEQVSNAVWDAPKGGHHRSGMLRFGGEEASLIAGARWLELVIPGVADVPERVLRWQVAP